VRSTAAACLLAAMVSARSAAALTLTPYEDDRYTSWSFRYCQLQEGCGGTGRGDAPPVPFGPFDHELAVPYGSDGTVTQHSTLGALEIEGSGAVRGSTGVVIPFYPPGITSFDSTFVLSFTLDEPALASLIGSLDVAANDLEGEFALASVFLCHAPCAGPGPYLSYELISGGSGHLPLSFTGILPAGAYELFADAYVEPYGAFVSAAFSFQFAVAPVPESSASALAGAALAPLLLRRRHRRVGQAPRAKSGLVGAACR